ncbi:hypothetical protein P376_1159 [Streptomyces sp. HCCB10043]|nr:hypothetical protein P376_1159 [Streptomyces sp. HCCB10043]
MARSVRKRALHPRRILVPDVLLSRFPDPGVGVGEEGGSGIRGQ